MTFAKYRVEGMTCANCTRTVTEALERMDGVSSVRVDLSKESVHLTYDESKVDPEFMRKAVKRAGYDLIIDGSRSAGLIRAKNAIALALSALFLVFGIMMSIAHIPGVMKSSYGAFFHNDILGLFLGTVCLIALGYPRAKRAVASLLSKRAGMDALVAMSALASYGVSTYIAISNLVNGAHRMGFYDALLMVLSVVSIGSFIESKVKALSGAKAKTDKEEAERPARVLYKGRTVEVSPEQVLAGDQVIVPQGERIPADGTVVEGTALLDTASLTGESTPIRAGVGAKVYASTTVIEGNITVRADSDNLESLFVKLERESYALNYKKGHLGKLSDTIAMWFVPAALLLAIAAFFIDFFVPSLSYHDWEESIVRAASVLVVSCPCAFGLAVPLTSLNGFYRALKSGVLFHDGSTFERVRKVDVCLFDKTGTLTDGTMQVTWFKGDDTALALAKGLESFSSHPIARAVLFYRPEIEPMKVPEVKEIPGQGVTSSLGSIGRIKDSESEALGEEVDNHSGSTLVGIRDSEGKLIGLLALEDTVSEGAQASLETLRDQGVDTYILTGDGREAALRLGEKLGFSPDRIRYSLTPDQKMEAVKELSDGKVSAYVGDGVNDLGAMAAATLSIASSNAVATARDKADCTLLSSGLKALPAAIGISRKCYRIVIENFVWALVYNVALIPLAAIGELPMWSCALAMIVSNITLMLNSLRASRLPRGNKG